MYFIADKNTSTLANFRGNKKYHAKNGAQGEKKNKTGKGGEDLYIKVPPGTQVIDSISGEILLDLVKDGQKVCLLKGGKGGTGPKPGGPPSKPEYSPMTDSAPVPRGKGEKHPGRGVKQYLKPCAPEASEQLRL